LRAGFYLLRRLEDDAARDELFQVVAREQQRKPRPDQ
jgi:hypothetical protein